MRGEQASTPDGKTVYAIGDIHGRADLLADLLETLRADARALGGEVPTLVFLGDYVDRGPQSPQVIDLVLGIPPEDFQVAALMGNHEAALMEFLRDPQIGGPWTEHGGAETLLAYGVEPPARPAQADWRPVSRALADRMPPAHLAFLESLRLHHTEGDYFFCHAGVRPGAPLEEQSEDDLLWIRGAFLNDDKPFEKVVVHGHTPEWSTHSDGRRIGLDTGAYLTGVLSAVRLRGTERTFFSTEPRPAEAILPRPAAEHAPPTPIEPAPTPVEAVDDRAAALAETLKSLRIAPSALLGRRIAAPAFGALDSGDLDGAAEAVRSLLPATVVRLKRALAEVPDLRRQAETFVGDYHCAPGAEARLDSARLMLLFHTALQE